MDRNFGSIIETDIDGTNYTCAACFSCISADELFRHACFDEKNIYFKEGIVYCQSDNDYDSNEEVLNEIDIHNNGEQELDAIQSIPHSNTPPKNPKKDIAMWTDKSTLALLACYETRKEDLDHPVKRGKIWALIANDLLELGYKFSGEQVRWKFNTLTRKYKDCIDNSKRTGTGAMTFKFFDQMENILGDRKTIKGQDTISSNFFTKKNPKSKSLTTSCITNTSDSSLITQKDISPSTSSTTSIDSVKKRNYEDLLKSKNGSNKHKQVLDEAILSNTETTVCPISTSNTQKSKRSQHGTGSRTAANKIELEKQWLQYLHNEGNKNEMRKEKQEAYEKRKAEEMHMKKKFITLKEKQLDIKQTIAKRNLEEKAEWHRDKLHIEKQKCRLLKELLESRTSSHNKKFKTDTDSSCED